MKKNKPDLLEVSRKQLSGLFFAGTQTEKARQGLNKD